MGLDSDQRDTRLLFDAPALYLAMLVNISRPSFGANVSGRHIDGQRNVYTYVNAEMCRRVTHLDTGCVTHANSGLL